LGRHNILDHSVDHPHHRGQLVIKKVIKPIVHKEDLMRRIRSSFFPEEWSASLWGKEKDLSWEKNRVDYGPPGKGGS